MQGLPLSGCADQRWHSHSMPRCTTGGGTSSCFSRGSTRGSSGIIKTQASNKSVSLRANLATGLGLPPSSLRMLQAKVCKTVLQVSETQLSDTPRACTGASIACIAPAAPLQRYTWLSNKHPDPNHQITLAKVSGKATTTANKADTASLGCGTA